MRTKIYYLSLILFIFWLTLASYSTNGQNIFPATGAAGIGTNAPDASSLLEIRSTAKGFLMPRMTQAQRNAIASPAKGLMIYQTNSTPGYYYYSGTAWTAVTPTVPNYTAGQGISITNGVITNLGDQNAGDDITINTAAGGDLVGTFPSPKVAKLQGVSLYPIAPTTGQVLKYNGTYWIPSADNGATYTAGSGLSLTGTTFTNTAPDKVVSLTPSAGINVTGTYPNFTIGSSFTAGSGLSLTGTTFTNTAPDQIVSLTPATGINVTGTYPNFTVGSSFTAGSGLSLIGNTFANTAPDQTVALTPSAGINITGTYPNFTIGSSITAGSGLSLSGNILTNTAPDQVVSLTPGSGIAINGTYPNFTISSGGSQGWNLTGNVGTNSALNFIGTTDAQPLLFKVNNTKAGTLQADGQAFFGLNTANNNTGSNNAAFGGYALQNNTTGNQNVALGNYSLNGNVSGSNNIATGFSALSFNTTGNANIASGFYSLVSNTTGSENISIGHYSSAQNISGYSNVAIGTHALLSNIDRSNLVAVGDSALYNNGLGVTISYAATNNTALGSKTLYSNTSGFDNTASGFDALYSNTDGEASTANGAFSSYSNTDGSFNTSEGFASLYSNTTGNDNDASGVRSLYSNTTGNKNLAYGEEALYSNTVGSNNIAIGFYSLHNNSTGIFNTVGNNNTAVGYEALFSSFSGSNNTAIGTGADISGSGPITGTTAIGANALVTASYQVRIGDATVTSIGGYANWTNISDGRVKKNIKQNIPGLAFINKLNPVTYNLDLDAADKIIQRPVAKDKNGKAVQPAADVVTGRKAKEAVLYTGFVAQDVEKAAKSLNYDFSGVDVPKNDKDLYGLRYSDFVVPLVKAVQELSALNDAKDAKIDTLQEQINELRTIVLSIQQKQQQCSPCNGTANTTKAETKSYSVLSDEASLEQNVPNPFSNTTVIKYSLPQKYASAYIVVTDKYGKTLKQVNVSGSGKGNLTLDASVIAAGAYNYSLYVENRLINTKQMILAK